MRMMIHQQPPPKPLLPQHMINVTSCKDLAGYRPGGPDDGTSGPAPIAVYEASYARGRRLVPENEMQNEFD